MEAIPGLTCNIDPDTMIAQTRRIGLAIAAQTPDLAPADGKLYALRDVTATVMSIPLIAASVMSKKLAIGADYIGLDVKCGSGAFMRTLPEAVELARAMVAIGKEVGRNVHALVTNMDRPLGRMVGNALEVKEAIQVLNGLHSGGPLDLYELTLDMGSVALLQTGMESTEQAARSRLISLLADGSALEKFRLLIEAQGGNPKVVDDPNLLGSCPVSICGSPKAGFVAGIDPLAIANAVTDLGGGRKKKEDSIDPLVGIEFLAQVGDRVSVGQPLIKVHHRAHQSGARIAQVLAESAFTFADSITQQPLTLGSF